MNPSARYSPAMPEPPRLAALRAASQRRAVAAMTLWYLPGAAVGIALAYRYLGSASAALSVLAFAIAWARLSREVTLPYDLRWLRRRLNAALPACEDSLDLLLESPPLPDMTRGVDATPALAATSAAGGLSDLQRARVERRLQEVVLPDLRPPYPRRSITLAWSAAVIVFLVGILVPAIRPDVWRAAWARASLQAGGASRSAGEAAPIVAELEVTPPAYTGLAAHRVESLETNVPEGSRVAFALRLPAATAGAALEFLDAGRLELRRDGDVWRGERVIAAPMLYRVEGANPAAQRLHRLDVIPDRAPEITVREPDRTLVLVADSQKTWDLGFEASDDYGLGPAELSVALAQGSGENVTTTRRTMPLTGDGDGRHRVYRQRLDLVGLGFAAGDDLIVRLSVLDNRPGTPNRTLSPSIILRWPAPAPAAGEDLAGLAQKTLPAYFASERQLIIDTEALQAERPSMASERFAARADELGVEQQSLRMRYGEFLGEESERSAEHDDDATAAQATGTFGATGTVTSEYGHMHDKPEAATLLDPDTRRLLKAALDQMWQAEGQLRLAHPEAALPFEYKALGYIKEVQQAERIYLARVGVRLPQVDASRRLTGDRNGLQDHEAASPAALPEDGPIEAAWRSLEAGGTPDVAALEAWARSHRDALPNALDLISSADHVRSDPHCAPCRAALAAALWTHLPPPATAVEPRVLPDAAGAAYLDALGVRP